MVEGDPGMGHTRGAANLRGIDLRYTTATSKLQGVDVQSDLGTTYGVRVHQVLNYVTVGATCGGIFAETGSASANIHITGNCYSISFSEGTAGPITVDGLLLGNITGRTLGNVTLNGTGTHTGNITVEQQNYGGTISINGTYGGMMSFTPALTGTVSLLGNLAGSVKVNGSLSGQVRINGSLLNGSQANDVWVTTTISPTGAIAVDYDGWDAGHDWAVGAVVRVGSTTYTRDNWVAPVYEITGCRGDLNNDAGVDFADINPFTLALNDAAGYATAFPGLGGSREWHGDANCDGAFNFGDINPFVNIVNAGECSVNCLGSDAVPEQTPATLAAALHAHVWPELRAGLLDLIEDYFNQESRADLRSYRQAVHAALAEG